MGDSAAGCPREAGQTWKKTVDFRVECGRQSIPCTGPVHPARVANLISEYIEGRAQGDAVVRTFGVVPMQPLEQVIVEGIEIAEQEIFVIVDELLLDGAIEAFAMRVHLGRVRGGVPMQ